VASSHIRGYVPDEVVEQVKAASRTRRPAVGSAAVAATADFTMPADLSQLADAAARRHGIDPELVRAVVEVESAFQPSAVSRKGAQGLMQLMPATARSLGVSDPLDPSANLDGGTRHLRSLLGRYGGDLPKALAAYNAGEGAVARHNGVPPYKETREYVDRVLRRYETTP
jgi:soluble lytic murein transglycosylase-like protein